MRCTKCGTESKSGRKFCANCGTALAIRCPNCNAENEPSSTFCEDCGAALTADQPSPAPENVAGPLREIPATGPRVAYAATVSTSDNGERRHLTVLFCDLVGSTEIAANLDPEEWREVAGDYHRVAAEAITRFGGHVAKFLGDGVLAYFGWPLAHDNDAERGTRAGLAILEGILKLNHDARRPKLAARVGIDSGAVVVATTADKHADIFGETPNIAARLQADAMPGTLLITAATHRLISGLFVVDLLGPRRIDHLGRRETCAQKPEGESCCRAERVSHDADPKGLFHPIREVCPLPIARCGLAFGLD